MTILGAAPYSDVICVEFSIVDMAVASWSAFFFDFAKKKINAANKPSKHNPPATASPIINGVLSSSGVEDFSAGGNCVVVAAVVVVEFDVPGDGDESASQTQSPTSLSTCRFFAGHSAGSKTGARHVGLTNSGSHF